MNPIAEAFRDWREQPWAAISRPVALSWIAFYGLFLLHAFRDDSGFLLIDNANLVVHEAGHLLFGWFGETLGLYGGTLLQFIVPFGLAVSFAYRKHTAGAIFCLFFFFENFLYMATYMADAQIQELPLVSVGGDDAGHDWHRIFSGLGILKQDTRIAAAARVIGWTGMLATVAWLAWRVWHDQKAAHVKAASA
jgi:hypothetical protein